MKGLATQVALQKGMVLEGRKFVLLKLWDFSRVRPSRHTQIETGSVKQAYQERLQQRASERERESEMETRINHEP